MSLGPHLRYSDDECHELFATLFPHGVSGADVLAELAPEGWENSPLNAIFHPSPEQVHEETVRMHENMKQLFDRRKETDDAEAAKRRDKPPPKLDEIRAEHQPQAVEPQRELRELVGMCLWDVFSDNHEVSGPDGRVVDLGSFRASAGFLAEVINRGLGHPPGSAEAREMEQIKRMIDVKSVEALLASLESDTSQPGEERPYGYMDFYMGTQMVADRADLSPVYRMMFRRLKHAGCDWTYHFPRLSLVDMRPLHGALKEDESDKPAWAGYDPSTAFAEQQEDQTRDEEIAKMRADLDEAHREAVEAACEAPPPKTVAAYRDVYGEFPEVWPPEIEE